MVQDTSIKAYKEILKSGLLSNREKITYEGLFEYGPCTDRELAEKLGYEDPNFIRPRRNSLVKSGLVESFGKKKCSVSKKEVYLWRIRKDATLANFKKTSNISSKIVEKPQKMQINPVVKDYNEFIDKLLSKLQKSEFGENIWYFKKLIYEVAQKEIDDGEFQLQCLDKGSENWESFYTGTEDETTKALDWNVKNAKTVESGKKFRVIKI